jgi:S1/P1 Nuclease
MRTTNIRGQLIAIMIALVCGTAWCDRSLAWGDEGHEVIALIAQHYLNPAAARNVSALLAADPDSLTAPTISAAATWADKFRDSDRDGARQRTRLWHFVDLEISAPDLGQACFGHPGTPPGTPASEGPAQDCVVDKIDEFTAELKSPATDAPERIVALKFLLHLVGDVHQPLHASDDHDRGGNNKRASAAGLKAGTLHHYWDTEFVELLGLDPKRIAAMLVSRISAGDARTWSRGTPSEWALDSFKVAKDDAYGRLPAPNARGSYRLPEDYVAMATRDAAMQLSKAGVRLAMVLNDALGR